MVQKFDFYFAPADQNRRIHLYLPDEYEYTQERYPVLYMFDGHNLYFDSDATFGKSLGLKEFLDAWGKKLIVVGIQCSDEDRQRVEEYCPYDIWSPNYGDIHGRGSQTMDWIVGELKPYIDRAYRTWSHRGATAIAGYSMGGMMALFAVIRYNHVFSKSACISPSINRAVEQFRAEIRAHEDFPDTRIFFSWGTDEYPREFNDFIVKCILDMEAEVQRKGARTWLHCQQGGQHNEGSWQYQVPEWMHFLWY